MTAPDTHLKTRQVAEAIGVSVSTIKRWVDSGALQARRTVGRHRLVALSEALEFAKRQGLSETRLTALDVLSKAPGLASHDQAVEELSAAVVAGDGPRIKAIIHASHAAHGDAAMLADNLVRPVMQKVGDDWASGVLDVFQEHQASQSIVSAVSDLIEQTARARKPPFPLALGATPEGDIYTISLLLGELVLREAGWEVRNVGPNLPFGSLARAIRELKPKLVFLSVSHVSDRERFSAEYQSVREAAATVGAAVALGGRAVCPDLRARLVYASFGERMAHLSEFARRMAPSAADLENGQRLPSDPSNLFSDD